METIELPDTIADLIPDWQYTDEIMSTASTSVVERRDTRSPGLHVSGVIKHILIGLEPKRFNKPRPSDPAQAEFEDKQFAARIRMGLLFEDILSKALAERRHDSFPDRYLRPGEQTTLLSGGHQLIGTPDIHDVRDWCIEEWKATWMSLRHVLPPNDIADSRRMWHYLVQLKTYCYMCHCDRGRLRVLFINGDYKFDSSPHGGPQFRCWEFRFTRAELYDNWKMIQSHGLQLAARRKSTQ